MDFALSPEHEAVRARVAAFVSEHVMPAEADRSLWDAHENISLPALEALRAKAKAAGLWAPQVPVAMGGMGLPMVAQAAAYEEANRSLFGPVALNCAAPDDGNMRLLSQVATPAQRERWLAPIVSGQCAPPSP